MRLKGVECRLIRDYGYRDGDPERDVDRDGQPVDRNYVTIIKIADCPITEENGRRTYHPKDAPQAVRINHGATWYGYGETREQNRFKYYRDENGEVQGTNQYWTTAFYAVHKGKVYRGTIYHFEEPPRSWLMDHADKDSSYYKWGANEVDTDALWKRDSEEWEKFTEQARIEYLAGRRDARKEKS